MSFMQRRLIRSIAAISAAGALVFTGTGAASAAVSAAGSVDPLADVRAGYAQLGLSPTEADVLLDKLTSGRPLDSMTLGAAPVRTDEFVQVGNAPYANDGDQVTVTWFADGSPAVVAKSSATTMKERVLPSRDGARRSRPPGDPGKSGSSWKFQTTMPTRTHRSQELRCHPRST